MSVSVKSILDRKGRAVATAGPSMTVEEAARLLAERKIGAVVITGVDGRIVGIFTERDLVNAVAAQGAGALSATVGSLMTQTVYRCTEESTVHELMGMMSARRFRHVPVEKDGQLAGIISIGDVVKSRIAEVEMEAEQIKAYIAG